MTVERGYGRNLGLQKNRAASACVAFVDIDVQVDDAGADAYQS